MTFAPHIARHLLMVVLSLWLVPSFARAQPSPQRAVLVTGASSGIGRKITERLASQGFFVYAGARSQKDLDDLATIRNVQAVRGMRW